MMEKVNKHQNWSLEKIKKQTPRKNDQEKGENTNNPKKWMSQTIIQKLKT